MHAKQLFQAGRLDEAVQAIGLELRSNPTDSQHRTFLFELLCFAGDYDRAEKQLDVLAQGGPQAEMGTLVYRSALRAERTRQSLFKNKQYPDSSVVSAQDTPLPGAANGKSFRSLIDADPRIGPRLEIFAAGTYLWIPFQHIASLEIPSPRRLRDLLWTPAVLRTGPGFKFKELGEVLLPVLSPFSWQHSDDAVRLGRVTVWEEEDGKVVPFGQKMLLVDGEELPLLELRRLEFQVAPASNASA